METTSFESKLKKCLCVCACVCICMCSCVCVFLGLFLVMECGFIQCDTSGGLEGLFVQFHNQWTFALGTLVPLESGE